ncbi:hypothetical protein FLP10_05920 [Agromyces intestinalis]|uniref:DUF559 domain-containing protein n=1 Tax=Agromyces intestinalis TaxID=2592652 RepID=A0A5C1YEU3_9MICO|nr:hypothetical protein [Agromyces intestinalis]QEO14010.1 hypothetical protein FLP10_05920 [Agromyces intestinalis]
MGGVDASTPRGDRGERGCSTIDAAAGQGASGSFDAGRMPRPLPLPDGFDVFPFAVADALAAGASRRRMRATDLHAPYRGVRTVVGMPESFERRCAEYAVIMSPTHAFSHATAARLHGMPLPLRLQQDARLHVTARGGRRAPRASGIAGHKTSVNVAIRRVHGLIAFSPADTWCSLASQSSVDELIVAGDRLLGLPYPIATTSEIDAAIARYGARTGADRLHRARLELRAEVYSARETTTRLVLVRAGLPEPEPNGVIVLRRGRRTRGDLVFRQWKVLVEYEGEHHLTDVKQWHTDVDRLNDLIEDGWRVIRVTKATTAAEIVERTRLALIERGWSG